MKTLQNNNSKLSLKSAIFGTMMISGFMIGANDVMCGMLQESQLLTPSRAIIGWDDLKLISDGQIITGDEGRDLCNRFAKEFKRIIAGDKTIDSNITIRMIRDDYPIQMVVAPKLKESENFFQVRNEKIEEIEARCNVVFTENFKECLKRALDLKTARNIRIDSVALIKVPVGIPQDDIEKLRLNRSNIRNKDVIFIFFYSSKKSITSSIRFDDEIISQLPNNIKPYTLWSFTKR